ncbi:MULTISPECIES: glycosyltransferase [unclassified Blastococcus]
MTALERLLALPERPRVVVVDNGSTDGTAGAVRRYVSWPGEICTLVGPSG